MKKYLPFVAFVVILGGITGLYFKNSTINYTNTIGAVSSVGITNNSAKEFTITMSPATASATTTSLFNSDSTDREITSSVAACNTVGTSLTYLTGAPLAALLLQMSTSTVGNTGLQGNTNYASNLTIATSSAWSYQASTTEATPTYVGRVWPAGTYLNITFNATNTAQCTVGVRVLSL